MSMAGLAVNDDVIRKIGERLRNEKEPLKARFRALFTLRNLNTPLAREMICQSFSDPSALLKHELAYCLGQMGHSDVIPRLSSVLGDLAENPMVRHEAAEALGAIGTEECVPILKQFEKDSAPEVSETCEIAISRIAQMQQGQHEIDEISPVYLSVDPALPFKSRNDVKELELTLLDEEKPLYLRYQAMFTLRDVGTSQSIAALGKGLKAKSALFRHEIAFVLGQIQSAESIQVLTENLKNSTEHEMVRHECAEALGSIGTPECEVILKQFLHDPQRVVRESCEVALDICEYEMTGEFQYADGLQKALSNASKE